jgi:hypothetical protein
VATGSLRGAFRGNLITGLVVLATDSAWTMFEYGGATAFRSADYYARLAGDVSAFALGLTVGGTVSTITTVWTAPIFGTWAPAVGGFLGLTSGMVAGTVGYIGGDYATRRILAVVNPDFLYAAEDEAVKDAREDIIKRLDGLRRVTSGKT